MRLAVVATIVCLSIISLSVADPAGASITRKNLNLPPQELRLALLAFSKASGLHLVFIAEDVDARRTPGVVGEFTPEEALRRLLEGTGLTFSYLDDQTVTIVPVASSSESNPPSSSRYSPSNAASREPVGQSGSFWNRVLLAQADQGTPTGPGAVTPASSSEPVRLEEVVVTAQKKSERLVDVPVPVTVLNTEQLTDNHQLRLQDYFTSVPGLTVGPAGNQSNEQLSIRGITTGLANPTVGITIDDMPFGGSTLDGSSNTVPDIDPGDLERIEVLRGPQGTLYGADSLGGLIKYVTKDPSTAGFSGRAEAGTSGVSNGSDAGYSFRGSANVPLSDTFAIRASGFTRQDPGYIDNVLLGKRDINKETGSGGRLSALWQISTDASLKVSGAYQRIKGDGYNFVNTGTASLQQSYVAGGGVYERKVQTYIATLKAKIGSADLTAVSGYNVNQDNDTIDYSPFLGAFFSTPPPAGAGFGVSGATVPELLQTKKLTEEVRITMPLGSSVEWLVGGFYTHEKSELIQTLQASDALTGAVAVPDLYTTSTPTTFAEYAAFTDLTYRVTDQFDVQVGGRESEIRQTSGPQSQTGPLVPVIFVPGHTSPFITPERSSNGNAFTYLLTPRYKISPDIMLYARFASGYRAGGPNGAFTGVPTKYDPDKTLNYEVGAKADVLDHKLSFDGSIYYIDWRDVQINLANANGFGYIANGSHAKSEGLELSVQARPLGGLTIGGWVTYNNAQLTQDALGTGLNGNRLPYASRFSGNLSLTQDFALVGRWTGFGGGAVSYVGQRLGYFSGTNPSTQAGLVPGVPPVALPRNNLPGYARIDLRAGLRYETWAASLFVNNVADRRGIAGTNFVRAVSDEFIFIQPRTVGITLSKAL